MLAEEPRLYKFLVLKPQETPRRFKYAGFLSARGARGAR